MTNTAPQFYEGCGRVGPIRCIFLSEFHPTAGSKISCQVCLRVCAIIFYKKKNVFIGSRRLCLKGRIRCG